MDEEYYMPPPFSGSFEEAWNELMLFPGYTMLEDALFLSDEDRLEFMHWPEHARYGRWDYGEL